MRVEARESGDARQQELAEATTTEKHMHLDMLPPDLAGQVQSLSQYDFESAEAQQRFDELMDQLRQQLAQQYFDQMAGAMSDPDPAAMQRTKDMMAALNQLLEKHQRGEDTPEDFQRFMDEYGDFFPEDPQDVEELLRAMAERMAQMQAMLNSMTPEQRAQLQQLAEQLMEDMDLRWQVDQLAQNLRQMFPQQILSHHISGFRAGFIFDEVAQLGGVIVGPDRAFEGAWAGAFQARPTMGRIAQLSLTAIFFI